MNQVELFLKESNAVEGVFDDDSFKQALFAWKFLAKQKELTVGAILKTHKILMLHQDLQSDEKGYFRRCKVWIGNREGMDWSYIPEAMEVWRQNAWLYPKNWQKHHVRYEHIHPFVDGNGRSGRLLMNWERIRAGLGLLVIKEKEKAKYYRWFD